MTAPSVSVGYGGVMALGLVALAGGALIYFFVKGPKEGAASATRAATDAAAGAVLGVGDSLGVPRTDETECVKALREGRTWDASFACPAGAFLKGLFTTPAEQEPSAVLPVALPVPESYVAP